MELIKKNIHMDRTKARAMLQFAVEDDIVIPGDKPDVERVHLHKAEFVAEELKPGDGIVSFRGYLQYVILYYAKEPGGGLVALQGRTPIEDRIYMQGLSAADHVQLEAELEDLTVTLIHSGKLKLQAMITAVAWTEEVYDEEFPVELRGEENKEYRRVELRPVQLLFCKNDIFRIKEEALLTSNYPNILHILWSTVSLGEVEFKVTNNQLNLSGDVHLFVLYEGEGESRPVRGYEKVLPFSGSLPCSGCREGMIPDVRFRLSQKEIMPKPDFDGEERAIAIELVMDLGIRIFEEERLEMISDVYGVTREIETELVMKKYRQLLAKATGKAKVTDHIRVKAGNVLQLIYSEGAICQKQQTIADNGILLQGMIEVQIMYITGNDETPYDSVTEQLPFKYLLDIPGLSEEDSVNVHGELEQLQVVMLDSEEMDVKAVISFSTLALKEYSLPVIESLQVKPIEPERMRALPGMVIYVVKPEDNLWNIGKKYYVTVDDIKKQNALETEALVPGQKLLIVKHG